MMHARVSYPLPLYAHIDLNVRLIVLSRGWFMLRSVLVN